MPLDPQPSSLTPPAPVVDAIGAAAGLAQLLLPQYVAYIVLGAAIAKAVPALYHDALSLLQNREPTEEEKAALARKLHALAHPETA